ncbi:MAG: thioesterase family protein [Ottowia sp.]|nr:acyl-CoA thioesterase [Ottowia sp.]
MRIEVPEQKQLVQEAVLPIRWADMDAMGHVNNAVYFRYMESGRIMWFDALGITPNPKGQGVVIVNAFCNFLHQLEYPGELLVRTYASGLKRSSLDTWVTLARVDAPARICANGGATVVWVDFPKQKSAPFPPWLREKLQGAGVHASPP